VEFRSVRYPFPTVFFSHAFLTRIQVQIIVIQNSRLNYSGVKAVEKREGGGAHNWGNHKDDIE
jgi:hypothetical protein